MGRLQTIENKLVEINDSVFQELCDCLLARLNKNCIALNRRGSQTGKQKTIKGTPDSFYLLPNGNFIFIEFTTNVSDESKLLNDVKACFDVEKNKIDIEKIEEIILCYNFNRDQELLDEVYSVARSFKKDIVVSFWSLDRIALELNSQHKDLVSHYLGLPFDTGQIVSIKKFITEYNKASQSIATPLNNTFVHREKEKEKLKELISSHDFIILTGTAGVGKTKLALEIISEYLSENIDYKPFCLSYKKSNLLEDLYTHINEDDNSILLVDDANRIDELEQITGFYRSHNKGSIKVLLTVRDYAIDKVKSICAQFEPQVVYIAKLTDQEICDLIKEVPLEILNSRFQRKITEIADGNPRIAVMASFLAKEKQDISALYKVSNLFEQYFTTFLKDSDEFSKEFNLKCLGLIAFFKAVPFTNKELTQTMLSDFQVDYNDFVDSIHILEKLELVAIDYGYVKIPEQNLSTYFFYKSFVKDNLLSFQILLDKYYNNNTERFKDCIIPANNIFGYDNVIKKVRPELKNYLNNIKADNEKCYKFLSSFWYYLEDETLEYLYKKIKEIPNLDGDSGYTSTYEKNAFSYERDSIIELLGKYFINPNKLKDVLELAILYIEKSPVKLPEFVHKIKESLIIDEDDLNSNLSRQHILFDLIKNKFESNPKLISSLFYEIVKEYLKIRIHYTRSGRNNSIQFYDLTLPSNVVVNSFRQKLWEIIKDLFDGNDEKALDTLESYVSESYSFDKKILEFDSQFIKQIFENYLTPDSFRHCKYVQDQIINFEKNGIYCDKFIQYKHNFTNPIYEVSIYLDRSKYKGKSIEEFKNYEEFQKLKLQELQENFIFEEKEEVTRFIDTFLYLKKELKNPWDYNNSLEYIIETNYIKNSDIGFHFLLLIVQRNIDFVPSWLFRSIIKSEVDLTNMLDVINGNVFDNKLFWKINLLSSIDKEMIKESHLEDIVETIENFSNRIIFRFDDFYKYLELEDGFFNRLLMAIYETNKRKNVQIDILDNDFVKYMDNFGNDFELVKNSYLQQKITQRVFDYHGTAYLTIANKFTVFLLDYVRVLHEKYGNDLRSDHVDFSFIWQMNDIESELSIVFDYIIEKVFYLGILNHFCTSFYKSLKKEHCERADKFLTDYLALNSNNIKRVNAIIDIAKRKRSSLFEPLLLKYISLNQNVDDFSKIHWLNTSGTYSAGEIISDITASEWKNIQSIVHKSELGIELIPIKSYLRKLIEGYYESGERERQRRFIGSDY